MNGVTSNLLFEINGFYPYCRLRNENGGDVALLIKDKLISEEVKIPIILKDEELVGVSVKLDGIYKYISCMYNIFEFIEK